MPALLTIPPPWPALPLRATERVAISIHLRQQGIVQGQTNSGVAVIIDQVGALIRIYIMIVQFITAE